MVEFINQLINGLQAGSIYALVALGYTMVYGIVKLINFAHGDIIMVGGYIAFTLIGLFAGAAGVLSPIMILIVIILTVAFCSVLGMSIEFVAYKPLRNASRISPLITAIGVSLLLQNLFQLIYGANPKSFPTLWPSVMIQIPPGGDNPVKISTNAIVTIGISAVLMVVLTLIVSKTKKGKAMRAVSEDMGAARLMGINVNSTISFTFAIGTALAGVAAILYCLVYPQLRPMMGSLLGLRAFVAAVLGGIGSLPGAMVGGLLIGICEALTRGYINSQWTDAVVFGILIVVLLVKPSGIFGKNVKEKV